MRRRSKTAIATAGLSLTLLGSGAWAQTTTTTTPGNNTGTATTSPGSDAPVAGRSAPSVTSADAGPALAPTAPPRFGRLVEHSVGLRVWAWSTPAWMVRIFAHVENGWSGPLSVSPGIEYVYRKGNFDIVAGIQYTSLRADAGFMHGRSENDVALERIESQLWILWANALFLWGVRASDWFEFQFGTGVGLGYVGGSLYRTQVNRSPDGRITECDGPGMPNLTYCDTANNHYRQADGTRYSEPSLFTSGSLPPAMLWLSLPHLALHFRPHRNVDIRLDGGWALLGFYGGLSTHFVFN